jgi:hypothetical protein
MSVKRQRIIEDSPLKKARKDQVRLPGADLSGSQVKTFSYRLPARLGLKFKLWCQLQGITAEKQLTEVLEDFLRDKQVVID